MYNGIAGRGNTVARKHTGQADSSARLEGYLGFSSSDKLVSGELCRNPCEWREIRPGCRIGAAFENIAAGGLVE